jgi:2'-5' RNA ligase
MTERIFYVLYVPDPVLGTLLDSIRLICNPQEKLKSHVTVRGPYSKRLGGLKELNQRIRGQSVYVTGTGSFESARQNTVFLHCYAEFLEQIWKKPDYSEYNPHMTLYDGASREFADALKRILREYDLRFSFEVSGLEAISSSRGQASADAWMSLNESLCYNLFRRKLFRDNVTAMGEHQRLMLVDKLLGIAQKRNLFQHNAQRVLDSRIW